MLIVCVRPDNIVLHQVLRFVYNDDKALAIDLLQDVQSFFKDNLPLISEDQIALSSDDHPNSLVIYDGAECNLDYLYDFKANNLSGFSHIGDMDMIEASISFARFSFRLRLRGGGLSPNEISDVTFPEQIALLCQQIVSKNYEVLDLCKQLREALFEIPIATKM
jgi:hypothetical protein